MDHALRQHAKYNASSAYRWMACPGSVKLSERAPILPPNKWALDGTAAHELLDYALKNKLRDAREASILADRIEQDTHPDAGERIDAVQQALDYIWDLMDSYEDAVMYVEHRFEFPTTVAPGQAYGTCDCAIHIPSLSLLYVIDYKHGIRLVEADGNPQTLYYGTSAVLGSGKLEADTIGLVIIQPRSLHHMDRMSETFVSRERLVAFVNEVDTAILAAQAPDAPLVPGEQQCRYCPARVACPALSVQALSVVKGMFSSVKDITRDKLPDPKTMTLEQLVRVKQGAAALREYLDDVDEFMFEYAMEGGNVPGFKLVEGRATRRWEGKPDEIANTLLTITRQDDIDQVWPRKLIGVTEADRLIRQSLKRGRKVSASALKEEADLILAALTLKESSGKLTLVPETDKRPAIDRSAATAIKYTNVPLLRPSSDGDTDAQDDSDA